MISPYIKILLISIAPFAEARAAVPTGLIFFHLPLWATFILANLGNILAVFLVRFFLSYVVNFLVKISPLMRRFFAWLFSRTQGNFKPWFEKYGNLALFVFVAIPLPMTGGWSGALASYIFGMPFWPSILWTSLGILASTTITTVLTLSGVAIEKYFGYPTLFAAVIFCFLIWLIYRFKQEKK